MVQSTASLPTVQHAERFYGDDEFTPTPADWAEFVAWCEEQDALQAELDALPDVEPSAEQWAVHVREYLAEHNLAEVPF